MLKKLITKIKALLIKFKNTIIKTYSWCWNTSKYTKLLVIPLTLFLLSTPIIFTVLVIVAGWQVAVAYLICRVTGVCPI